MHYPYTSLGMKKNNPNNHIWYKYTQNSISSCLKTLELINKLNLDNYKSFKIVYKCKRTSFYFYKSYMCKCVLIFIPHFRDYEMPKDLQDFIKYLEYVAICF